MLPNRLQGETFCQQGYRLHRIFGELARRPPEEEGGHRGGEREKILPTL